MESAHPKLYGIQTRHVPFKDIVLSYKPLEPAFDFAQHFDLFLIYNIQLLTDEYYLAEAKSEVGAAIRICKAIGQEHLGDMLKNIVGECFKPDDCSNLELFLEDESSENSGYENIAKALQNLYAK